MVIPLGMEANFLRKSLTLTVSALLVRFLVAEVIQYYYKNKEVTLYSTLKCQKKNVGEKTVERARTREKREGTQKEEVQDNSKRANTNKFGSRANAFEKEMFKLI